MKRKRTRKRKTKKKQTKRQKLSSKYPSRGKSKVVKISRQHGTSNTTKDKKRSAMLPGKRVTRWGSTYYETRKNRSDRKGKRT